MIMSSLCSVCSTLFSDGSAEKYGQKNTKDSRFWDPFHADISGECTWYPLHGSQNCLDLGLAFGCEICRCMQSRAPDSSERRSSSPLRKLDLSISGLSNVRVRVACRYGRMLCAFIYGQWMCHQIPHAYIGRQLWPVSPDTLVRVIG